MKNLLALALFAPLVAWGAEQALECPAVLEVKSAATPPAGWQVIEPSNPNALERVGFFAGHPSERASLIPDKTQSKKKGESRDIWNFSPAAAEETWVACFYTGTLLSIAKPVAKGVTRCEVLYRTTRSGSRLSVTAARCN